MSTQSISSTPISIKLVLVKITTSLATHKTIFNEAHFSPSSHHSPNGCFPPSGPLNRTHFQTSRPTHHPLLDDVGGGTREATCLHHIVHRAPGFIHILLFRHVVVPCETYPCATTRTMIKDGLGEAGCIWRSSPNSTGCPGMLCCFRFQHVSVVHL